MTSSRLQTSSTSDSRCELRITAAPRRTSRRIVCFVRRIAPGSIPKAPGNRVKTDRRDAKRLVRLFAAGKLSFAFVPSEADERFRDLVRGIDDAVY